jgi:hypothetical protein
MVQAKQEAVWGEAVEGVQVRLRAEKVQWKSGETPVLSLDVRNTGRDLISFLKMDDLSSYCSRIEVDGQRYFYNRLAEHLGPEYVKLTEGEDRLSAGKLKLDRIYSSSRDNRPLTLQPGKHVVRAWFWQGNTVAPSNPVEIEILPAEALTFGAVTERVFVTPRRVDRTGGVAFGAELVDLDSGKRVVKEQLEPQDGEVQARIRQRQLDVLGLVGEGAVGLVCFDMVVVPYTRAKFPGFIAEILEDIPPERLLESRLLSATEAKPASQTPITDEGALSHLR